MGTSLGDNPVVEAGLTAHRDDVTLRALQQRIRQQEILSELGVMALLRPFVGRDRATHCRGTSCGVLQNPASCTVSQSTP